MARPFLSQDVSVDLVGRWWFCGLVVGLANLSQDVSVDLVGRWWFCWLVVGLAKRGTRYCMVVVLLQYGLYSLTFVIWNFNILILLMMKVRVTGT
jgi:hypothetical protein